MATKKSRGKGKKKRSESRSSSGDRPSTPAEASPNMPRERLPVISLVLTVFLSAFLLFQVQPLLSRAILPWFGGTPAVWTTSMLFYQVVLFAGYCYAHWLCRLGDPRRQVVLHLILIGFSVALLPIHPGENWKPTGNDPYPTWHLLKLLTVTVGAPFFLLSTTAPLLQAWWSRLSLRSPYKLYALSNAGSLLALLSYPFVVEPLLGTRMQATVWTAAFVIFAVLLVSCAAVIWRRSTGAAAVPTSTSVVADPEPAPRLKRRLGWLFLAATGSALLLAMTNQLCQNMSVTPFLWVAPLALYLLSFIMCFGNARWYHRGLFAALMMVSTQLCAAMFRAKLFPFMIFLPVHLTALFSACMVLHGELVRTKPGPRYLTTFYLYLSAGGALGGIAVSLLAPLVFSRYYEYPFLILVCWIALYGILFFDRNGRLARGRPRWAWSVLAVLLLIFGSEIVIGIRNINVGTIRVSRNFYGVLSVGIQSADQTSLRSIALTNGSIVHGSQYFDDQRQYFEPTTYYNKTSGIGCLLGNRGDADDWRIGAVGLGVATIVAYAQSGDHFLFYEINPDVVRWVVQPNEKVFSFCDLLPRRGATGEVVMGDGRLSLERELNERGSQEFDVLILDAFTGDAIPTHLLTLEAVDVYLQHLKADGVLAVHATNQYIDLLPVLRGIMKQYKLQGIQIDNFYDAQRQMLSSQWILLARQDLRERAQQWPHSQPIAVRSKSVQWTDNFSNLLSVLK